MSFACVPACLSCRTEGCTKTYAPLPPKSEVKPRRAWRPADEQDVVLKCGDSIPWPALHLFGSHPHQVWCCEHPDHGWQTVLTKAQLKARDKKKRVNREEITGQGEICPF
jgi:hypothetical protein